MDGAGLPLPLEDVTQPLSTVVPAKAGTHTPQPIDVAALTITETLVVMGPRLRGDDSGLVSAKRSRNSKPEHEKHGLVALFFELRRLHVFVECDAAEAGENRDILLAASLERHRRRVEADADVDRPELLHGGVVEGREGAIGEAGEHEATRGDDRAAVVGIGNVRLCLALAGERIDGVEIGLVALRGGLHAAAEALGLGAERRIAREIGA